MKKIAIIGSTGSIGKQTVNVVKENPDKFEVVSIAGGSNVGTFNEQLSLLNPKVATFISENGVEIDKHAETEFYFGENSFTNAIIDEADIIVIALVGYKGIIAVLDAIKKGKNIALANKESLVVGGELVTKLAKEKGVSIRPIDSEHSAVWQALSFDFEKPFNKIILTCSGGAFRDFDKDRLTTVKASDALKHPNWLMGNKITVDCATLVNKAFEVIEAKWLYNTTFDKVDVIIHRESIIHSMVEYVDGSVMAQMSYPSMELPIQIALGYPERFKSSLNSLDFASISKLTFEKLDHERFPCFNLVVESGKKGGCYPAIANGANDLAVKLFLEDKISFNDIYKAISYALDGADMQYDGTFECLESANDYARDSVKKLFGE